VFVTHDIDEAIKLGDRVVVMNVGGTVEQFATPAEVLAHPASGFVADFVGSQRGLKQLSLISVSDVDLEPARDGDLPSVPLSASLLDALDAIMKAGAGAGRVLDESGSDAGTLTLERIAAEMR
jgi:osmoprotectant transport system ATP-binding protein